MIPPDIDRTTALFLDLDGTLLEIAAGPEQVVVPPGLPALLADLHRLLGGALAIVSGRSLPDIDRLLQPFVASAGGEHGGSLRFGDGSRVETPSGLVVPEEWHRALRDAAGRWPGVQVEPKPHGVTVHYRLVPERRDDVWQMMRALVPDDHPEFRLLPARKAAEIALRSVSKGHAVESLMARVPFQGRHPIFVGDDVTDEAGMSAARQFGGKGLRVAEVFGGQPERVIAWLRRGADRLSEGGSPNLAPIGTSP